MPSLLNPVAVAPVGQPFRYVIELDVPIASLLQGAGCQGDDGWIKVSGLPSGLAWNPKTYAIVGEAADNGGQGETFTVQINLFGTDEFCNPLILHSFQLYIYVGEKPVWSKNLVVTEVLNVAAGQQAQLELYVETAYLSDEFEKVLTMERPHHRLGNAYFSYSHVLDAILEAGAEKDVPSPSQTWKVHRHSVRRFYTRTRLVMGELSTDWQAQPTRTVFLGGIPFQHFPQDLSLAQAPFFGISGQALMDNTAGTLQVRQAPLYLSLFGYASNEDRLIFRFTGLDGTPRTETVQYDWTEESGAVEGQAALLLHTRRLDSWPRADERDEFTVEFESGVSQVYNAGPWRFSVDRSYVERERTLLYRSAKGGWQTFTCHGLSSTSLAVQRQEASRALQVGYDPIQPTHFAAGLTAATKVKVSTGWFDDVNTGARVLTEIMFSRQIYELVNGQWLPILLGKDSVDLRESERDFMRGTTIEYRYGFDTTGYSPL